MNLWKNSYASQKGKTLRDCNKTGMPAQNSMAFS